MRRTGYTGFSRTASGRLRRTEPLSPTSPTLKRSFEVEETDAPAHPSPHTRRTTNLRTPFSSRFQDLGARNSDLPSRAASETSSLRRLDLAGGGGGRIPEPVSRRTEISIDISSKQVDSSPSPGISRFGLKRPEIVSHTRNTDSSLRRAEPAVVRPQEAPAPPRRADPPPSSLSRIPDPLQRKPTEPPSPVEAPTRRLETALASRALENNCVAPPSATPNHTEQKQQPTAVAEVIAPPDRESLPPR
ncbi:hypothetical protein AGOR_G00222700 [Albula goreensis]|uniref:Uncharacterized protein n=1 Tax=Albula goreensis TaxID=1534307 RepID=A0A8T3CJS5_9TELE|nr:hypothetical protein AGOR_G00222700 [Albula goreensis]